MKTKAELVCILLGGYIITLIISVLFYLIISQFISLNVLNKEFDQGAAIVGILGWSATLYAAFVAGYLFTDWKEQYNINLEKDDLKLFKTKLNALYIITDYFEVHFREIHESLLTTNKKDFDLVILDYKTQVEECCKKRRQFSEIVNEYNFYLNYYLLINSDFNLIKEFEKINKYGEQLDHLLLYFTTNKTAPFSTYYYLFDREHLILREMLGTQIDDLNKRLRL